jgi:HEPN domain-containing protein
MIKKPRTYKTRPGDEAEMFQYANKLMEATEVLMDASPAPTRSKKWNWVIIVNQALAAEIYLKCLHSIENGCVPHGHVLTEFFEELSLGVKNDIRRRYELIRREHPVMKTLADWIREDGGDPEIALRLDQVLRVSERAFETFRYPWEYRPKTYLGCPVAWALNATILSLRPDFRARRETGRS